MVIGLPSPAPRSPTLWSRSTGPQPLVALSGSASDRADSPAGRGTPTRTVKGAVEVSQEPECVRCLAVSVRIRSPVDVPAGTTTSQSVARVAPGFRARADVADLGVTRQPSGPV